jgi:hypothetical protein
VTLEPAIHFPTGGAGSQFFSVQGARSDEYGVFSSDERQRNGENWTQPSGLRLKSGHTSLSSSTVYPPQPSDSASSGRILVRNAAPRESEWQALKVSPETTAASKVTMLRLTRSAARANLAIPDLAYNSNSPMRGASRKLDLGLPRGVWLPPKTTSCSEAARRAQSLARASVRAGRIYMLTGMLTGDARENPESLEEPCRRSLRGICRTTYTSRHNTIHSGGHKTL